MVLLGSVLLSLCLSTSVCVDEELTTLKGIEGESSEDKPLQQVNMALMELCGCLSYTCVYVILYLEMMLLVFFLLIK